MKAAKTTARIAGVLLLVGSLAWLLTTFLRATVVETGDTSATADNIRAAEALLRAGIAFGLVSLPTWLFAVMVLYRLLRDGGRLAAGAMVITVTAAVAVECLNLVTLYTALRVATDSAYPGVVGRQEAAALVMLLVDLHRSGALLAGVFWGVWLLPLGYLVTKSSALPGVLGVLLIVGGVSYLMVHFVSVLAPELASTASYLLVLDIGELFFVTWLIVKGVRVPAVDVADRTAARLT